MNLFDEQYRAHVTPLTLAKSPRSTPLITVEELRRATRPSTLLGLDPIFRNTGVDFRNVVLGSTIATSLSTASL